MFFPSTVFHSVQFGGQFALRMRCILAVYHNLGYVALNFKCAYQCDGLQALGYVAQETARLDQSKHLATWSWFGAIHLAGVHFPVPGATEYQQSVWTSETARAWKLAGASSRLFLVWNAESFRHAHCFFRSPCSTSWQDLVLTWHPDKQQGPEGRFAAEVGVSMCQPVFFFSPCIVSGISSIDGAEKPNSCRQFGLPLVQTFCCFGSQQVADLTQFKKQKDAIQPSTEHATTDETRCIFVLWFNSSHCHDSTCVALVRMMVRRYATI